MSEVEHKPSVFLSYSSRDQALADELRRALVGSGFEILRAQEVVSGDRIESSIRDLMRGSDVFVIIASREAVGSPWTAFEVGAAMAWEKPIFVVAPDRDALPSYLAGHRIVSTSELPKLIGSVKREAAPLTEEERDILLSVYADLAIPTDRLTFDPGAVSKLVEDFNHRSRSNSGPDRLLRELLRMRKAGKLPRIRRPAGRALRQKRSA